ncbi:hypothetical protein ACFWBI_33230 [Streptomyces sp. NPDC059982]|uniref:hypothetical protein n=1 Tax=unclassified Streptomyces TaxID=2593676 RepID=UPI0036800E22
MRPGGPFAVGQKVFDRDRHAHGDVVRLYPSPLVLRLADGAGVQWIARTVACEQLGAQPAERDEPQGRARRVLEGRAPVDVPPTELRVGDRVLSGGRLVAITDLRYHHGATRTMILGNGRVTVAERTVRVWRPLV